MNISYRIYNKLYIISNILSVLPLYDKTFINNLLIVVKKTIRAEISKSVTEHGEDLHNTSLIISGGAVPQPTQVTLSYMNTEEIHQCIQSSSWANMFTIHACINIQCIPCTC